MTAPLTIKDKTGSFRSPYHFAARDPRQLHEAATSTWWIVTSAGSGKPVAQLVPPVPRQGVYPQDALFGTVKIHGDIVEPVLDADAWEAEAGKNG